MREIISYLAIMLFACVGLILTGCGKQNSGTDVAKTEVLDEHIVASKSTEEEIKADVDRTVEAYFAKNDSENGSENSDDGIYVFNEQSYDDSEGYMSISSNFLFDRYWYCRDVDNFNGTLSENAVQNDPITIRFCSLRFYPDNTCSIYLSDYDSSLSFGDNIMKYALDYEPSFAMLYDHDFDEYVLEDGFYMVPGIPDIKVSEDDYNMLRQYSEDRVNSYIPGTWQVIDNHVEISVDGHHVVNLYQQVNDENTFLIDNTSGFFWVTGTIQDGGK